MINQNKINFLNSLKLKNTSVADIVKKHSLFKGITYNKLVKINAQNTNAAIAPQQIKNIYKSIYDCWHTYLTQINLDNFERKQKNKIKWFLLQNKYKPQNMSADDCYQFMHHGYDKVLNDCGIRPMICQNNNQEPINTNGAVYPDFIHCAPFQRFENTACRLYLNVKPENIAGLTDKLLQKCLDKRYRVYFKFWTNDNRNDTFLIYTNYNRVQKMVSILKEIKAESPQLFDGCQNINPLLTNIDNFIGFSEEPQYKHSSFNSERANAIEEFCRDVILKQLKNTNQITEQQLDKLITDKALAPYLAKHHVSGKYPSLNTETELELLQQKNKTL